MHISFPYVLHCAAFFFNEPLSPSLSPSATVSKLVLRSNPTLKRNINTDIEMKCSVTSELSPSSCYAVTWLLQEQVENKTIISSDRDAVVTFGSQLVLSDRQRVSMKRTKGPTFELGIRQAQISDSGSYICEVVEWLQDPQNEWYQLPSVSTAIKLTLIEPGRFLYICVYIPYFFQISLSTFDIPCNCKMNNTKLYFVL